MKPSEKSPEIEAFLEREFGRTTAIESDHCVPAPMGCGQFIDNPEAHFRDVLTLKEYTISGFCQSCQDKVFGEED